MTESLHSCHQPTKADFTGSDCLQNHSGSLETPFRTKMTESLHSCLQSIKADFIGSDCPLLHPGSLETPFRTKMTESLHSCHQSTKAHFTSSDCPQSHRAVNERGIDLGRLPAGMSCVRERNVAPQILHRKHALYYNG